jgi:hypothetical protein
MKLMPNPSLKRSANGMPPARTNGIRSRIMAFPCYCWGHPRFVSYWRAETLTTDILHTAIFKIAG